jgi:hypothetical protein
VDFLLPLGGIFTTIGRSSQRFNERNRALWNNTVSEDFMAFENTKDKLYTVGAVAFNALSTVI